MASSVHCVGRYANEPSLSRLRKQQGAPSVVTVSQTSKSMSKLWPLMRPSDALRAI
jgi:hypothetical protein